MSSESKPREYFVERFDDNRIFVNSYKAPKEGSGKRLPSLVFVPGLNSVIPSRKAGHLLALAEAFGVDYLAYEHFGTRNGRSTGAETETTVTRFLEDLVHLIDTQIEGPLVLVGSSIGAWLALLATRVRPERVKSVVAIAASIDASEMFEKKMRSDPAHAKQLDEKGWAPYASMSTPEEEPFKISKEFIEGARRSGYIILGHTEKFEIDCPVRFVHGMEDESCDWTLSTRTARALTTEDVLVTLIKDGKHRLSRDGDLEIIADVVRKELQARV